jgi:hypothetical protein
MIPNIWKPGDPVEKTGLSFVSWITPEIAISSYDVASSDEVLKIEGIRTVVSIGRLQVVPSDPSVVHEGFPFIEDGVGNNCDQDLIWALKAIHNGVSRGKTLVHCAAGISRSPGLVTLYLAMTRGLLWDTALTIVRKGRPHAYVHILVEEQLKRCLKDFPEGLFS